MSLVVFNNLTSCKTFKFSKLCSFYSVVSWPSTPEWDVIISTILVKPDYYLICFIEKQQQRDVFGVMASRWYFRQLGL